MSEISVGMPGNLGPAARALMARAAGADARAQAALRAAIDDAFLAPEIRLDDRTRAALMGLIEALATTIERELSDYAARLLTGRGEVTLAAALSADAAPVVTRLADAGLLKDADFVAECAARVRVELISAALPAEAPADSDTPSLLARLTGSLDRVIASAAQAVLTGESHRRAAAEGSALAGSGLPSHLHQRLLWWVAAAVRERILPPSQEVPAALDRAIAEAALRNIASNDGGDRLEVAAMRLAEAIDAQPDEIATLLDEALRDRRVVLFVAMLAHALGLAFEVARDLVLDPCGDRLWLALRALDLPRPTIARIGFRLCEGDGRRDLEAFADALDIVASVDADVARAAVAPLKLHPDYRAAVRALERGL